MTKYEVRENPSDAMPLGIGTVSVHATAADAFQAIEEEAAEFYRGPYATGGAYLRRIVVEVSEDGRERRVFEDGEDGEDY